MTRSRRCVPLTDCAALTHTPREHKARSVEDEMDWEGLTKERIQLGLPLLIIKGSKGFLGCGYINVESCNKTGEACGIVSAVRTHDDMLVAELRAVSSEAAKLGLRVGMKGQEALELLR